MKNSHLFVFSLYPAVFKFIYRFSNFCFVFLHVSFRYYYNVVDTCWIFMFQRFINPFLKKCWGIGQSIESFQETVVFRDFPSVTVNMQRFLVFSSTFVCSNALSKSNFVAKRSPSSPSDSFIIFYRLIPPCLAFVLFFL